MYPVVINSRGIHKLLRIPALSSDSGRLLAMAIFTLLNERKLKVHV